ncbi:MAG: chemotaxis protein CheX [Chitinophagaceae bacterium]|nr:chemotaxis protein CheX [Oligoflexus sp.]
MSNVDLRLSTNQYLSKKPWAFVQNVLGFELVRGLLADEKFEVIFTDGGDAPGGIEAFVKQVRASRRNANTLVIYVSKPDEVLKDDMVPDKLFRIWPWPMSDASLNELASELELNRQKSADVPRTKGFDARLLNAVLVAIREVVGFYFAKENIEFGKPQYRAQPLLERSGLTGLITIEGAKFQGSMALAASLDFIKLLALKMFPGQDYQLTKEGSMDMIGELSNQLVGGIKMQFGTLGLTSEIGLPKVFIGKNHKVPHKVVDTAIFLALNVNAAICEIELTIAQATDFAINELSTVPNTGITTGVLIFD